MAAIPQLSNQHALPLKPQFALTGESLSLIKMN
jgi:hypothetical protein